MRRVHKPLGEPPAPTQSVMRVTVEYATKNDPRRVTALAAYLHELIKIHCR